MATIADIRSDFALLDEWEDRYRYIIELGRQLPELPAHLRSEANKVRGCASQVWLATTVECSPGGDVPRLRFRGDSDAHIVRGLVAILFSIVDGKSADQVLSADPVAEFEALGLKDHITPQRSNGFRAMVERVRDDAKAVLAQSA